MYIILAQIWPQIVHGPDKLQAPYLIFSSMIRNFMNLRFQAKYNFDYNRHWGDERKLVPHCKELQYHNLNIQCISLHSIFWWAVNNLNKQTYLLALFVLSWEYGHTPFAAQKWRTASLSSLSDPKWSLQSSSPRKTNIR